MKKYESGKQSPEGVSPATAQDENVLSCNEFICRYCNCSYHATECGKLGYCRGCGEDLCNFCLLCACNCPHFHSASDFDWSFVESVISHDEFMDDEFDDAIDVSTAQMIADIIRNDPRNFIDDLSEDELPF